MKEKKGKKFSMAFRLRSLFCKRCNLTVEFFGNDPVVGKCHCCKTPLVELPVVSDSWIETHKTVVPYGDSDGQISNEAGTEQ